MCRLLAWVSPSPQSLGEVIGGPGLSAFTNLSSLHDDGWGTAAIDEVGKTPKVTRSTLPAFRDALFRETVALRYRACIVHFRKASSGLAVEMRNTHPFVFDEVAFAHNGSIWPQSRLDEIVPEHWRHHLVGTTDSERYFMAVMAEVAGGMTLAQAIDATVTRLTRDFEVSSLNAMFVTPDALYVVNSHDPAQSPGPEMEPDGEPYYQLRMRVSADSLVVASSGFPQRDDDGWATLDNHTLLMVDVRTLATKRSELGSRAFVSGH
ncbi:MAG TPA: class II glutamine amidotransferase [Acidimicrobiales bacterium]|nr:class II glutamine amidotransferase [Acidimicrobiales bacterium]